MGEGEEPNSEQPNIEQPETENSKTQPSDPEKLNPAPVEAEPPAATPHTPGIYDQIIAALRRLVTRPEPYVFNGGGYQTLNFIPAFVTMLLGLMAGEFIRRPNDGHGKKFLLLVVFGLLLLGSGWGWHAYGGCPLVKRIWTPSWTLFSTGWTLLILAGFYGIIDGLGWKSWSFPLVVAGMNSMVLYMFGQLLHPWTAELLKRHINDDLFLTFGAPLAPVVESLSVLLAFWLFVYWLYRQRIFVRI
jgi:predicted acyltransferase